MRRFLGKGRSNPPEAAASSSEPEPEPTQSWIDWHDVEQRLDELTAESPESVDAFLHEVLDQTRSPLVIASLARHPDSAGVVRSWLKASEESVLLHRAESGELFAAALASAARLLLRPEEAESVAGLLEDHLTPLTTQYFQFRDSVVGHRPVDNTAPAAPAKHRLIIADQFDDPRMLALLLPGCERATFISTADTYGQADFSDRMAWTGSGDVTVEHVRSRITRYSAEYIGLHEATARIAEKLAAELEAIPGLLRSDDRPFIAVEIADFLFFRALRHRAVDILLADPTFDHVVIAITAQSPYGEFPRSLSRIERIRTDPRIEFVSISRDEQARADFWRALDAILTPPPLVADPPQRLPTETVVRHFNALAGARPMALAAADSPWLLLATADNSAYNSSTAAYAAELAHDYSVRVLHLQGTAKHVMKAMASVEGADSIPTTTYEPGPVSDSPLADLLRTHLQSQRAAMLAEAASPHDRAAAAGLHASFEGLMSVKVVPALLRAKVLDHWFTQWHETSRQPAAAVLIPQRSPGVGAVAAVARRHGVPTVAAEPHVYVPEYSRYNKIAADYYGVLSEYFVDGAVRDFGMVDRDRVRVIGSPRLTAPPGYEAAAARERARAMYATRHNFDFTKAPVHVVFFCQPSGWQYVAPLWELLLDAIEQSGAHLFFKPHPEEAPARVLLYEEEVERRGLTDRVTRLDGDAGDAVDLADVVATAYSAAALDAAIRGKPVVCITVGDTPYPVDTAAISGADVCRSVEELVAYLSEFVRDAAPAQARARAWVEREQQFIVGPGPALRQLVADAIRGGKDGLRTPDEVPSSLFTDEPHPVFRV